MDQAPDIVPSLAQQRGGFGTDDQHPIVLVREGLRLSHLDDIQP